MASSSLFIEIICSMFSMVVLSSHGMSRVRSGSELVYMVLASMFRVSFGLSVNDPSDFLREFRLLLLLPDNALQIFATSFCF